MTMATQHKDVVEERRQDRDGTIIVTEFIVMCITIAQLVR